MVFSSEMLRISNNKALDNTVTKSLYEDRSFFLEMLKYLSDESKQIDSMIIESFTSVEEGVVNSLLKSAIKKIDITAIIRRIIKEFISLLEKIWNEFHSFLINFMNQNSVVNRYEEVIRKLKEPVYFSEPRYIYTNLGTTTSYTSYKNSLNIEYSDLVQKLTKFGKFSSYESLVQEIENIKSQIDNTDNYFDKFRAQVVGKYDSIPKDQFATSLFRFFRNDGIEIPASNISPEEIQKALNSFNDYKKVIKEIQKDKQDMQKEAKKLEQEIMSINLDNYIKDNLPKEIENVFIEVLKDKVTRVKTFCDIYLQVFSAKIDAVKESRIQYRKMLIAAVKAIIKEEV